VQEDGAIEHDEIFCPKFASEPLSCYKRVHISKLVELRLGDRRR